jgi:hypothetical protein
MGTTPGLAMLEATPSAALLPYVTRLCAYREHYAAPVTRSEMAMPGSVLILAFGTPMEAGGQRVTAFGGGLGDRFTVTRVAGPSEGVEVFLTPFGARRLYGMPMRHLTNRVVPIADLLGPWAGLTMERLAGTPSWRARLALADRLLRERIAAGPALGPELPWAWARLVESGGRLGVSSLAESLASMTRWGCRRRRRPGSSGSGGRCGCCARARPRPLRRRSAASTTRRT